MVKREGSANGASSPSSLASSSSERDAGTGAGDNRGKPEHAVPDDEPLEPIAVQRKPIVARPCKECRSVKTKCVWGEGPDPRCLRCRTKLKPCTKLLNDAMEPCNESEYPRTNRRSKWVCVECKKRKRACVGGQMALAAAGQRTGRPDMVSMTPCDFCARNKLDCRWVLPSANGEMLFGVVPLSEPPPTTSSLVGSSDLSGISSLLDADSAAVTIMEEGTFTVPDEEPLDSSVDLSFLAARQLASPGLSTSPAPLYPFGLGPVTSFPSFCHHQYDSQSPILPQIAPLFPQAIPSASSYALSSIPPSISAFEPAPALPSNDCLYWLLSCFWTFHGAELSRNVPIHRTKFLKTAWAADGEASPLLWMILWGTTIILDSPANKFNWSHPDLTPSAKAAIRERARLALIGGLTRATSDLAAIETADVQLASGFLSRTARRVVPVLQSLVLGMFFYERSHGNRHMISIVSLIIKLSAVSAHTLKAWIVNVTNLVQVGQLAEIGPAGPGNEPYPEVERWIENHAIDPPFSYDASLLASIKSPAQLKAMSIQDQDDVVLLAEYAACFLCGYGVDAWAADILGIPLGIKREDTEHVPVPFDGRLFGIGDKAAVDPLLQSGFGNQIEANTLTNSTLPGIHIVPVMPMGHALLWLSPLTTPDQRQAILAATVTDCFRIGPHFVIFTLYELERILMELRLASQSAGFLSLYPHAVARSPEIAAELQHIKELQWALYAALPKEIREAERNLDIERMYEATIDCPQWISSLSFAGIFLWLYDSIAGTITPPPEMEPGTDWYLSPDGTEAAKVAVLGARLIQSLLDSGFTVNNGRWISWFHTKVDRLARILFLHLSNAQKLNLPTVPIFRSSLVSCITWFQGLGRGGRYAEWLDRLAKLNVPVAQAGHGATMNKEETAAVAIAFSRMVVSSEDRALEQYRDEMTSIDTAVQSLV